MPTPALSDAVPLEERLEAVKNCFSKGKVCNFLLNDLRYFLIIFNLCLSNSDKCKSEKKTLTNSSDLLNKTEKQCVVRMWDAKNCVRLLAASGLACVTGPVEDPKVAAWMLDPGAKESNICNLVIEVSLTILSVNIF